MFFACNAYNFLIVIYIKTFYSDIILFFKFQKQMYE